MKSILIISAVYPPEPLVSATISFDLASVLSQKENVIVLSPFPTRPAGFSFTNLPKLKNVIHIQLSSFTSPKYSILGRLRESHSFGIECFKYIMANGNFISRIYSNTWPLLAQLYCVFAAKRNKIPITIHIQDIYPEALYNKFPLIGKILTSILLPIDRYTCTKASSIIVISNRMKTYISTSRKINHSKVFVIENWQDENLFLKPELNAIRPEISLFTFMYLGNIGPVAGVELLINSFAKIATPKCRLVIAGSGSMKEELIRTAEVFRDIRIEFWSVSEGKVPFIQGLADILLLPMKKGTASSSIPSKLAAYMFSRKPIIACVDSDSDTARVITESNCGWLLPPEDIQLLADCMNEVIDSSTSQLKQLGENGFNYALEHFSKKNNLNKLVQILCSENGL